MKIEDVESYPLRWPDGWPKTAPHKRDSGKAFGTFQHVASSSGTGWKQKKRITPDAARRSLRDELGRLGAKGIVISSNVKLRSDGEMSAGAADRRYDEPGISVWFTLKGKMQVMAQDAYDNVASNMRSLALSIEAMRTLGRHGVGVMMERAFAGFAALPAPDGVRPKRSWWIVLNYGDADDARADLSVEEIEARFRTLAKRRHPDVDGGSTEAMAELVEAREQAVRELGGAP